MMRTYGMTVLLALVAVGAWTDPAIAQTVRYVDASSVVPAPGGTSWADAFATVGQALAPSVSGDQIWVAAGTYTPGALKASTFQLKNNVALYGGFAGTESSLAGRTMNVSTSVLSGEIGDSGSLLDNCDHVVTAETAATLDGFTIAFGRSTLNNGGGLYNFRKGMTVRNCTFRNNHADEVPGNTRGGGGAIFFEGNSASGLFTLDRCRFLDNTTLGSGGAILIQGTAGNFRIDNSLFIDNFRGSGRWACDIANERGSILSVGLIVNCTFIGRGLESLGSGTAGGDGTVGHIKLINSILYKDGTGTNPVGRVMNDGHITLHNCLIDGSWNIGSTGGSVNLEGAQLMLTDPEFLDLDNRNLHLLDTSPCLDAGTSSPTPAITLPIVDLDGNIRPLDVEYDIGAYEGGTAGQPPSGMSILVR